MHSWGAYAAYSHKVTQFRDEDSQVYCTVKVAKGELKTRQWANVRALDGTLLRVSKDNPNAPLIIFGQYGAKVLAAEKNSLIVAVPSSSHTVHGQAFTGASLAEAIAQRMPAGSGVKASALLAFKQVMPKASAGEADARNKPLIKAALKSSLASLKQQRVVLVDDVCSSGAHLMACAEFLRDLGATVDTAVCIGRTTQTQHATPLAVPPEDIEDQFSFFFDH